MTPFLLIEDLVEQRTEAILNKLVYSHMQNTLTGQEALSAVATIAGLRGVLNDLHKRLRKMTPDAPN